MKQLKTVCPNCGKKWYDGSYGVTAHDMLAVCDKCGVAFFDGYALKFYKSKHGKTTKVA